MQSLGLAAFSYATLLQRDYSLQMITLSRTLWENIQSAAWHDFNDAESITGLDRPADITPLIAGRWLYNRTMRCGTNAARHPLLTYNK